MKKILFPTDFSKASLNAFRYALHLAEAIDAEIVTLHVYEIPVIINVDYQNFLLENYNIFDLNEFEIYRDEVPGLRAIAQDEELDHIKMTHILKEGIVSVQLLKTAADENVDYIVMGTNGAKGLGEVFLGTVTEKVMNEATAKVLAIPVGCRYQKIRRLLFLTRYQEDDFGNLEQLCELAQHLDAQVDALQVSPEESQDSKGFISRWQQLHPKTNVSFYDLNSYDFEGTVTDFMDTHHTGIAAVSIRQKSFFEKLFRYSLSRQLAFHSKVPLLALHPGDNTTR